MVVPLSTAVSDQIRFLLHSLDGSNSDSVFTELCKFVKCGKEGSILLLKICFEHIDIYGTDLKDVQLDPTVISVFKFLLKLPNFSTLFCQCVRNESIREGFLGDFSNALCLTMCEKIAVGLALSDSESHDIRTYGKSFCMSLIKGLLANPVAMDTVQNIQQILTFLSRCDDLSKHMDTFVQMLHLEPSRDHSSSILAPLMIDDGDEACLMRNVDFLSDSFENELDVVLAEIEKENNMIDIMMDLGYGCTVDTETCKYVLSHLSPLTELTISRIISTVACTHSSILENQTAASVFLSATGYRPASDSSSASSWNINTLVDSIKELAPDTNWEIVIENLDHEGFYIPDEVAFTCFMSIYHLACQDPFPLQAIWGSIWKNTEGQLSFLKYAVSAPPEVFSFSHSARQLASLDAVQGLKLLSGVSNQAWSCLDLLELLCQLAERGYCAAVKSMLAYPLKQCPEVLLLGLAQVNTTYNLVQHEVLCAVFAKIVANSNRNGVIHLLWCINPSLLTRGFTVVLATDPEIVGQIVDICYETEILNCVLEMIPFAFAIRLAVIASHKELLDLEKWLIDKLSANGETFIEECLNYLKEVQCGTTEREKNHHSAVLPNVYPQTVATFLKVLQANYRPLSSCRLSDEIEKLNISFGHSILAQNDGIFDKSPNISYGDDIELEANSFFQRMFSEQLSVSEMVDMLARFKDSSDSREQSIFECMINNLFEESRFFPKYPERQLGIAAMLFGLLIKNQFVTHLTLGIAIRCVLDALRKPADSKMFAFGTKALEQFINRLDEWPQYCNHILQISHLRGTHPELVAYIEGVLARKSHGVSNPPSDQLNLSTSSHSVNETTGSNGGHPGLQFPASLQLQPREHSYLEDTNKASANMNNFTKSLLSSTAHAVSASTSEGAGTQKLQNMTSTPSMLSSPGFARPPRGFGSALNIETLVAAAERRETPIEAPSSEIQDKISFIINNISTANVEAKAKEFSDILKEQYYPWFAQYMVMKRASIEPNFHELYLKFLDKANSKALNKEIVQATYENCKVLLGSDLIKSSSEERSLLKNLGSWLGKLTIGRNQVLRARDIDPKSLIVEAYEKGLMIAVIPFTSKILEPCQSSLAYQPPNPWTMGILALLVEIYAMPNLKMNLKFDIEVLFKNLGVNMKDVAPTSLLKDRVRIVEGNPDFSTKDVGAYHPPVVPEDKPGVMSALNQIELPLEVANASHFGGHSHSIPPYGAPSHTLMEDDKLTAIGFSDQLPAAQGLLPAAASQSPYNVNQLSTLASIQQHAVINPKIGQMGLHLHFQRVLSHAIDRAVKEIVPGIVQRSVSIAIQTTKELVIKDYALESDESRIYNAAHLMVGSLAGSLAHVTCKEPLRASILSQLRNMLQGITIGNELLEAAILMATNDNLDLGCASIENSAHEKALEMIDPEIGHQLSLRRKHRESIGSSMYDPSGFGQGSIGVLPETLQPKPGRLSLSQQRVYEDFGRTWQTQQTVPTTNPAITNPAPTGSVSLPRQFNASSPQLSTVVYSSAMGSSGLGATVQPLELPSEEIDSPSPQMFRVGNSGAQQKADIDTVPLSASAPILDTLSVEPLPSKESVVTTLSLPLASSAERIESALPETLLTTGDALDNYQMVASKLEDLIAKDANETEIQSVVSEIPQIIIRCVSRDEAALAVAQKVFKVLYENSANTLHVSAHLAILAAIRDVCKLVVKELTNWVIYSENERKLNKDITVGLISRELLNLAEYNIHMAKLLDGGRNKLATEFAISLVQTLLIEESKVLSELHSLIDVLAKLAGRPGSPESLQKLVEIARNPTANAGAVSSMVIGKDDKARQTRDKKSVASKAEQSHLDVAEGDSSGLNEQVTMLFAEWFQLCELPATNEAVSSKFILKLHQNGFLKGDDTSDRFFRILLELSVSHCLTSEGMSGSAQQPMSFLAIDIYAKLVFSILKYCPVDQGSSKLSLLPKILAVTVRFIQKDADDKKTSFNQRPYFRLFINWLSDVSSLDPVHDAVNFQVLTAFANAFHALQPLKVPAFSFAWLELVSHRLFMPKLLTGNSYKGWPHLHRLLVDLFQFMEPFLRNAELGDPIRILYKGTLRVLLVLLHDFPEFLCEYHFSFCDVIPPSCIQMRNIILSAFPRNMRLPDPSTPNLKIDLLAEMSQSPRILSEIDAALKLKLMKSDVDEYLKTRQQGSSFICELKQRLQLSPNDANRTGTHYNVPLINSLVLYVGIQAIQKLQPRNPGQQQPTSNSILVDAALDIFHTLIMDLDTEGRYLFLNAIANQLRYPNNHTHYFSFILLYLFYEANQEVIQEQITRVLLERLIVNRPHPWGLLITFIELIKNPRYKFWNRSFTRCAPEIEKLFESVSRSCGGPKPVTEGMLVSGALSDAPH